MKSNSEQLGIFGQNRYHDWVIFFFTAVVIIWISVTYNIILYINSRALVSSTSSEVVVAPSQFEDFKRDVEYVENYLTKAKSASTSTIPADPSVR